MPEKEKIEMFKSQCHICLLADKMKICPLCAFNMGLVVKAQEKELIHQWIMSTIDFVEDD